MHFTTAKGWDPALLSLIILPASHPSQFAAACRNVCDQLVEQGFWADFTDPASGFPVRWAFLTFFTPKALCPWYFMAALTATTSIV